MLADTAWKLSREGDPAVAALFSRHYTCRRPDRQHRFGPGERLVLLTRDETALFV